MKPFFGSQILQSGGKAATVNIPVYAGRRLQRGSGLGSLLGGLFRSAVPILKKSAVTLGKQALNAGLGVAEDLMSGKNVKAAFRDRAKLAGFNSIKALRNETSRKRNVKRSRQTLAKLLAIWLPAKIFASQHELPANSAYLTC